MIEIYSVNNFNDEIAKLRKLWDIHEKRKLWFRGVLGDYPLLPKVYRSIKNDEKEYVYHELYIKNVFRSLYKNYHTKVNGTIEQYSLMQHFGIPTRLLDFSESSLTALFFSVEDYFSTEDCYVYVLNPGFLNSLTYGGVDGGPFVSDLNIVKARVDVIGYGENEDGRFFLDYSEYKSINLDNPIAFYPETENNLRISAQKGVFVLWGIVKESLNDILINKPKVLECIHINNKKDIYTELKTMGITERSIYPDMIGLSNELNSVEFIKEKSF